jgi:hypothetical protein
MELLVQTLEAMPGEETEPVLAGKGGTHQPLGLVGREAEEDLLEKFDRQRRCWRRRRRRHCRSRLGFLDGRV